MSPAVMFAIHWSPFVIFDACSSQVGFGGCMHTKEQRRHPLTSIVNACIRGHCKWATAYNQVSQSSHATFIEVGKGQKSPQSSVKKVPNPPGPGTLFSIP